MKLARLSLLVAALALPTGSALAQTARLSPPLVPVEQTTDAADYAVSPDGAWVVYTSGPPSEPSRDLYAVPFAGGTVQRLNEPVEPGTQITSWAISPTSNEVAFLSDSQDAAGPRIWIARIDGSSLTPVTAGVTAVSADFAFTPDGAWLVFRQADADGVALFRVPATMPGPVTEIPVPEQSVLDFRIHPDSTRVAVRAGSPEGVFVASLDASAPTVRLSDPAASVDEYAISPDGTRLFFVANNVNLVSADLASGASVDYDPLPFPAAILGIDFGGPYVIASSKGYIVRNDLAGPGNPRVLVQALNDPGTGAFENIEQTVVGATRIGYRVELNTPGSSGDSVSSVRLSGGAPKQLDPGGPFNNVGELVLDGSGTRVIYSYGGVFDFGFVSVNLDGTGGAPTSLDSPNGLVSSFSLNPAGTHVTYFARPFNGGNVRLQTAAVDGSTPPVEIGQPFASLSAQYDSPRFTPDGQRVVYLGDQVTLGDVQVFSVAAGGPADLEQHSGSTIEVVDEDVERFWLSDDGSTVVLRLNDGVFATYWSVPADGSAPASQISNPIPQSDAYNESLSPDGDWFVYQFKTEEFRSVPTGGGPANVVSNAFGVSGPTVITADSQYLVYRNFSGGHRWMSTRLDGLEPAQLLGDTLFDSEIAVASDGLTVVFENLVGDRRHLFARTADLSGPLLQLTNGSGALSGTDLTWQLAPDEPTAVYRVKVAPNGVFRLWSVPVDLSSPPMQISVLGPGLEVASFDFVVTPVTGRVLYTRNQLGFVETVLSSPIDGLGPTFDLGAGIPSQARFADVASSNGELAVIGDLFTQRWLVSTDGSTTPILVPRASDDPDTAFSVDGSRLVYEDFPQLSSWDVAGGSRPVKLLDVPPGFDSPAKRWEIDPTGRRVVYWGDQGEDDVDRLFATPIAHPFAGSPLAGTELSFGDVRDDFVVTPDGTRVIYVLDAQVNEAFELFVTDLRPGIDSLTPDAGRADDLVIATLDGRNFVPDMTVTIGGEPAALHEFIDSTRIRIRVPPLDAPPVGPVKVEVPVVVSDGVLESLESVTYTYLVRGRRAALNQVR